MIPLDELTEERVLAEVDALPPCEFTIVVGTIAARHVAARIVRSQHPVVVDPTMPPDRWAIAPDLADG